jgi:hypothetical protein
MSQKIRCSKVKKRENMKVALILENYLGFDSSNETVASHIHRRANARAVRCAAFHLTSAISYLTCLTNPISAAPWNSF